MKAQVAPAALASYIRTLLKLPSTAGAGMVPNVDRLLANRFFQGTVLSSFVVGGMAYCQIRRTGETQADGNSYLCITPGYAPIVGDVVECIWRDLNVGFIWAPISRPTGGAGTLGYAAAASSQTGITTLADLTGLAVTVTVGTGRRIRITGQVPLLDTIASEIVSLRITEASTDLQIAQATTSATTNAPYVVGVQWIGTPTGGSHNYKLRASLASGTGSVSTNFAPGFVPFILVEDIGV